VKKRNIIKEQDLYRKRKKDEMEIVFGDIEYDQPKLDIVEYSLKANFQYKDAVLYECPINIIFKGKSILNGLAQCIKYGIVKPPLPSFVRDLPQSGKNIFFFYRHRRKCFMKSSKVLKLDKNGLKIETLY